MLVLTRKKSQLIQIGDNIVIKVIRTGPGSVKLGIDAPSHVRVMRGELNEELTSTYEEVDVTPVEVSAGNVEATPVDSETRLTDRVEEEDPVMVKALSRKKSHSSAI